MNKFSTSDRIYWIHWTILLFSQLPEETEKTNPPALLLLLERIIALIVLCKISWAFTIPLSSMYLFISLVDDSFSMMKENRSHLGERIWIIIIYRIHLHVCKYFGNITSL